jgi:hypothetical protein
MIFQQVNVDGPATTILQVQSNLFYCRFEKLLTCQFQDLYVGASIMLSMLPFFLLKFVVDVLLAKCSSIFLPFVSSEASFRFVMMMQIIFGGSARVDRVNYKKWWR